MNIGANNGIDEDPLAALLRKWRNTWAVAAEMDPKLCEEHRGNFPHVHVFCGPATPANAWDVLDPWLPMDELGDADPAGRRVLHINVLKVDIDSYDCSLIETYLRGAWSNRAGAVLRMLPQLILTEVNDAVPPPVQQALLFSPSLAGVDLGRAECAGNIPLAGCSLSYQVAHFARFGYSLILYAQAGAVFAHESVMQELAKRGIRGPVDEFECYWHAPLAAQCASGRQIRRWFHETEGPKTAWDLVAEVTKHLRALERHFGLPAMPMILEV